MSTVVAVARRVTLAAVLLVAAGTLLVSIAVRTDVLRMSRVLTGSMDPAIPPGALVASRPVAAGDIEVGQVVVFLPPEPFGTPGGAPVAHRVTQVAHEAGDVVIHTKGDANAAEDPWTLNASKSTVFQVAWSSPAAGRVADTAGRGGLSVVLTVVVALAALRLLALMWRPSSAPRHRQEKPAVRWLRETATS
jgi:signal peptidase